MGAAHTQDLRDRVLAAYDHSASTKGIVDTFRVSPARERRFELRWCECGETTPRKMGNPGRRKIDRDRLPELVREQHNATFKELHERLGIVCSSEAICLAAHVQDEAVERDNGETSGLVSTIRWNPCAIGQGSDSSINPVITRWEGVSGPCRPTRAGTLFSAFGEVFLQWAILDSNQ